MGAWRIPRQIREAKERVHKERALREQPTSKPPLRLVVCGDSTDRAFVFAALDYLHHTRGVDEILMPDEPGAAVLAAEWAAKHGIDCIEHVTDWREFGSGAREIRDEEMMRTKPDGVVVFGTVTGAIRQLSRCFAIPTWMPRNRSSS